ncbi:hypothetical protein NDI43_17905 [Microcoleus vaginatus GB2-A3]|uniref:hypothetical protein n=1 Tax=Microcoleus vaginatus TaxID=119532 RepID=UPI0032A4910A
MYLREDLQVGARYLPPFAQRVRSTKVVQKSAEINVSKSLDREESIHFGQLTIFESSETAYLKALATPQTVNPRLSQVRMRIISFGRSWEIRQKLLVMPISACLLTGMFLRKRYAPPRFLAVVKTKMLDSERVCGDEVFNGSY